MLDYQDLKTSAPGQIELGSPPALLPGRVRRAGGGRKRASDLDPALVADLEMMVEPLSRGDPMSPLRWTCKSVRTLAEALGEKGHAVSPWLVWRHLRDLDYSLQGNRKMEEGNQHADRNAPFEHINGRVLAAMKAGNPVISVDTKKKELVGNYKNPGRKWHRKGESPRVQGTTSPILPCLGPIPTESTISPTIEVTWWWEQITIPASSRWRRSADGGVRRDADCIRAPRTS